MPVLERVPMEPKKLYGENGAPVISGYQGEKKPWFTEEPFDNNRLVNYLEHELLRRGIGERDCPTIPEWMTYVLGGAVIAHLKNALPILEGSYFYGDIEDIVWSNLWSAAENPSRECNRLFLGNALSLFALHSHHAPPEKPYRESWLSTRWGFGNSPVDGSFRSMGNLRIPILRPDAPPVEAHTPEYQRDLIAVTDIIPETLEIAVANVRQNYHW